MKQPMPPSTAVDALQEALALHRAGKHELAMQRYVAILQQNPGNLDALYYVAVLALQQGQLAEGLKVIARALEVEPRQARLHNLKGQAHLRLNQDDEALQSLQPRHRDRSSLCRRLRQPRHAARRDGALRRRRVADFDRALELRPDNAEDHCNRAGALADLGRVRRGLAGFCARSR